VQKRATIRPVGQTLEVFSLLFNEILPLVRALCRRPATFLDGVKCCEELGFVVGVQGQEVPGPFTACKDGDNSTGRSNFGTFLAPFQQDPPASQSIVCGILQSLLRCHTVPNRPAQRCHTQFASPRPPDEAFVVASCRCQALRTWNFVGGASRRRQGSRTWPRELGLENLDFSSESSVEK
jgi:hypothetical protein